MLPKWARPIDGKIVDRIEKLKRRYNLTNQMVSTGIGITPWATRKLQYFCLEQNRRKYPNASEREIWTFVLASRFEVKLASLMSGAVNPPYVEPLSEKELLARVGDMESIISNCDTFEDVVKYIIQMDTEEGQYTDPSGIGYELNDVLEGKTLGEETFQCVICKGPLDSPGLICHRCRPK